MNQKTLQDLGLKCITELFTAHPDQDIRKLLHEVTTGANSQAFIDNKPLSILNAEGRAAFKAMANSSSIWKFGKLAAENFTLNVKKQEQDALYYLKNIIVPRLDAACKLAKAQTENTDKLFKYGVPANVADKSEYVALNSLEQVLSAAKKSKTVNDFTNALKDVNLALPDKCKNLFLDMFITPASSTDSAATKVLSAFVEETKNKHSLFKNFPGLRSTLSTFYNSHMNVLLFCTTVALGYGIVSVLYQLFSEKKDINNIDVGVYGATTAVTSLILCFLPFHAIHWYKSLNSISQVIPVLSILYLPAFIVWLTAVVAWINSERQIGTKELVNKSVNKVTQLYNSFVSTPKTEANWINRVFTFLGMGTFVGACYAAYQRLSDDNVDENADKLSENEEEDARL